MHIAVAARFLYVSPHLPPDVIRLSREAGADRQKDAFIMQIQVRTPEKQPLAATGKDKK